MSENSAEKPHVTLTQLSLCAVATGFLWVSSLTVLLPVFLSLMFCRKLREKFFSWIFATFIADMCKQVPAMKKKLFEIIKDHIGKEKGKELRFLEIGVGSGANFGYYPENCTVTLLDANPEFDVYMRKKLQSYPDLKVEKTVCAQAENMKDIPDSSYDVVVCTHLMCSVSDVDAVLKEVKRVLKPEGKFAFLEHVAFPASHPAYWIQKWMTPLWKVYMNGCCLDRSCHKKMGNYFCLVSCRLSYPDFLPLFFRPHVTGIATK